MKNKLLTIALTVSTLFGVTSCNENDDFFSLQIWTYYNGDTETSFQKIVDEYNNTRGLEKKIVVSALSQGTKVSDLLEALLNSATEKFGADDMPDLFLAYPDCAFELDKYDKIVSLDNYFTDEELSIFNEGFLNEGRFGENNSLKILPISKSTEALYINKTDFDKFLNDYPDTNISYSDLSTIEGLINVSKIYYEKTNKAFFGRDSLDNYFVIAAKQLGIDVLSYNEGTFGINFNEEVFKKIWDSYYIPFVNGYFSSIGRFRSDDIKSGEILSYVGSTSSGGYFPKKVVLNADESYDIEAEVLPTPVFEGKENYAVSQGAGFCISKSTRERELAAVDFLKWLCENENIKNFSKDSGYFPSTTSGFSNEFIESQTNSLFKASFKVAKQTTNEYKMYTNIVGLNGTNYRNLLRDSLNNYAKDARRAVIESGNDADVLNNYTSDDRFYEWFNSLKKESSAIR